MHGTQNGGLTDGADAIQSLEAAKDVDHMLGK